MFFTLSKLFWLLFQPVNLLLIALAAALVTGWSARKSWSYRFLGAAFLLLLASAYSPLPYALLQPLENRFQKPELPSQIDGILIMGGGFDTQASAMRGTVELDASGDRIVQAAVLAKRFPQARIVYSGGRARIMQREAVSADLGKDLLRRLGIAESRILLERTSRNTRENAVFAKQLAKPRAGETWLVVTSAFHMPRTIGTFRAIDWHVLPWPVDYAGTGNFRPWKISIDPVTHLGVFTLAVREWIGLAVYYATGRTGSLFPAPEG